MTSREKMSAFDAVMLKAAVLQSFVKLSPLRMMRNPVMFIVELGAALTTLLFFASLADSSHGSPLFILAISLWLWATILFANFAEALAEGRGKAQAEALRRTRKDIIAKRLVAPSREAAQEQTPASALRKGDVVLVEADRKSTRLNSSHT